MFKAKQDMREDLENRLMEEKHVNNLIRVNGEWQFLAELIFRNLNSLELFVENLNTDFEGIKYTVLYVMDDLKREAFLVDSEGDIGGGPKRRVSQV
jgi:hypothetical protein